MLTDLTDSDQAVIAKAINFIETGENEIDHPEEEHINQLFQRAQEVALEARGGKQ